MKNSRSMLFLTLVAGFTFAPVLAHAHTGTGLHTHGFGDGLAHPLTGFDHILAMIAVGLWAAQIGGRAVWIVPSTFVAVMALGGALGMAGVAMPFAEQGILLSVLLLGLFIAAAVRLPVWASAAIVGMFALCHGHAHGAEAPAAAAGFLYAAGFIVSTVALHASGITLGQVMRNAGSVQWIRAVGAAIAIGGVALSVH